MNASANNKKKIKKKANEFSEKIWLQEMLAQLQFTDLKEKNHAFSLQLEFSTYSPDIFDKVGEKHLFNPFQA